MAPPGLFHPTKRAQPKNSHTRKSASKLAKKVDKPPRGPAKKKGFSFSRFPAEIQSKIWGEALQKPACHTFKIHKSRESSLDGWEVHLHPIPKRNDSSAYRRWKSLLHSAPGDNKLKNISFQAGFSRAMVEFQRINVKISGKYKLAAAIDAGTDLVILEFERGRYSPSIGWFLHSHGGGPTGMNIDAIRERMRHFKRVAIRYKSTHQLASQSGGPFSCYCPPFFKLGCENYKACYFELGCFLDCFENLEEFYLVVETKGKAEEEWIQQYRKTVCEKRYCVTKPETGWGGGTFELSHFFDAKSEYIQHCPPAFFDDIADKVDMHKSPILRPAGPRQLLVNAMNLYRGQVHNEAFKNKIEERDKVKFGILLEYPFDKKK